MRYKLGAGLVALVVVLTGGMVVAQDRTPVRVIFDTDIQGDADDVGAVAMLHALADRGEVEILAMGVSAKNPWSPLCLDALNTYYGRPDLSLGVVKGPAFERDSKYARAVAESTPSPARLAEHSSSTTASEARPATIRRPSSTPYAA